ncbi:MAG TPA: DUF6305 family protein [Halanaerobiales bacterium]|nr:DUF6305 family protein [Halanaerobiales bacterium]
MFNSRVKSVFMVMMLLILVFSMSVQGQEVTAEGPIIATTCGQSPGALMVTQICKQVGLECEQQDLLEGDYLKENDFKTVIITMGTSGKGMGAAGTDMKAEVERINGIIEVANEKGMTIIGAHIEGEARRVDDNDAKSIEVVAPYSHIIIVREDSNKDGYFTDLGEEKDIPVYVIEKTLGLTEPLKEIFQVE